MLPKSAPALSFPFATGSPVTPPRELFLSVARQPIVAPTHPSHIISAGGRRLPIYPFDWVWLARAVQAEGEPRDLVAQTLVNRWAWFRDRGQVQYPTLTALVRAYAQPVNPAWMPGGHLHEAVLRETADPAARAELQERARVRRDTHAKRTMFYPDTHAAVAQALGTGPITIPQGAVHYSASASRLPVLVPGGPSKNTIFGAFLPSTAKALYRIDRAATARRGTSSLRPLVATIAALGLLAAGRSRVPARH